jgi:hypothetical protein
MADAEWNVILEPLFLLRLVPTFMGGVLDFDTSVGIFSRPKPRLT